MRVPGFQKTLSNSWIFFFIFFFPSFSCLSGIYFSSKESGKNTGIDGRSLLLLFRCELEMMPGNHLSIHGFLEDPF